MIPFENQNTCNEQTTKTIFTGVPSPRNPSWKCQHSPYRCERPWKWSPSVGQPASYLWSLLWPGDYGDPSDGQSGVVVSVLLQDILWPNKGAILAQGRGEDLWRGLEATPKPVRNTLRALHKVHHPPATHTLRRNWVHVTNVSMLLVNVLAHCYIPKATHND